MSLTLHRVTPGPASTAWLRERIRSLQRDDPLATVTVIVDHNYAGLYLRHRLAQGGYAAVRFVVIARLAETIAAGHLGGQGRVPLNSTVQAALVRAALQSGTGPLSVAAEHAGVVQRVVRLESRVRRSDDPAAAMRSIRALQQPTADAALDAIERYRMLIASHRRYDDVDLLDAATHVAGATPPPPVVQELGSVILFVPRQLDTPSARLVTTLAMHLRVDVALDATAWATIGARLDPRAEPEPPSALEATPDTRVIVASDAVEEVRTAVRACLAALEADPPVPLHREAIVYKDSDAYATQLRDTLTLSDVAFSSLDGRSLSDTLPARALLALIRLRERDFARDAVIAWVSCLPANRRSVLLDHARWDQLSRQAGVVRGIEQWSTRLGLLAGMRQDELDALIAKDPDDNPGRQRALRRDIEDARAIGVQVEAVAEVTAPPPAATWPAYVAWIQRMRDELLVPDQAWGADVEAAQMITEIVEGLGAAADVEPEVSVPVVLRTLEDALRYRRRPEGRLGRGVLIGPHRDLVGIDVDRVHVLGVLEGAYPSAEQVDPLVAGDPLHLRDEHEQDELRAWEAVRGAAAREVVMSAPLVDADGRPVYPSPWLLDALADAEGRTPAASAVRLETFTHARLRRVASHTAAAWVTALTVSERREWDADRAHRAGIDIATIAIARRDDLPLGRALVTARARRSTDVTQFDGNLATIAPSSQLLARGLALRGQSPSAIQQWAQCPFHYLLARILHVTRTDVPEDVRWWQIAATERGTLIHAILEEFFREVAVSGDPPPGYPYTEAHSARIASIAATRFTEAEERGVTGHALVWATEKAAILKDLRTLLARDAEMRADGDWRPAHLEQAFGFDRPGAWKAAEFELPDGRTITLRGLIDRIDVADGRRRIIDYKTGRVDKELATPGNMLSEGKRIQLALYAEAARQQALREGQVSPEISTMYWFATSKGGFMTHELDITPDVGSALAHALAAIDNGVRAGCFLQVPGEYSTHWGSCANCAWCEYDTLCPAGREVLAGDKRGSSVAAIHAALQPAGAAESDPADIE